MRQQPARRYRVVKPYYKASNKPIKMVLGATPKKPLGDGRIALKQGDLVEPIFTDDLIDTVVYLNGVKGRLFTSIDFLVEQGILECCP